MEFNFCPKCGFKFDDEYNFCPKCGYAFKKTKKTPEPLFDFSDDTAKYEGVNFGGFDEQLKKQEEIIKKAEAAQKALEETEKKARAAAQLKVKQEEKARAAAEIKAKQEEKAKKEEKKSTPTSTLTKSEQNKKEQAMEFFRVHRNRKALNICLSLADKDIDCQYLLGCLYDGAYDVRTDKRKAFYWYKRAADNGQVKAQLAVAESYYKGIRGAGKSERLAKEWYQKAAAQGDPTAKEMLRRLK